MAKKTEWLGAIALVAGESLVAYKWAIRENVRATPANARPTFHGRLLGFLPSRTQQAPGQKRPRAGLANKLYTYIARVLEFLLSFNKEKLNLFFLKE